jgi:two-component system sensor histidine kinase TtrS
MSLIFALVLTAGAQAAEVVRIGILAPEGETVASMNWRALMEYLDRALPGYDFRLESQTLDSLRQAVAGRRLDFVITNSGNYVDLEAAYGLHRIATLDNARFASPDLAIASAVVVRADRKDLRHLADLRGKRVLAVDEHAFGGYQLAWHELDRQGLDPHSDLASLIFTGFPLQDIVSGVGLGRADAGIVRACVLEDMAGRGEVRLSDFRVLDAPVGDSYPCLRSTPLYPDWPFSALRDTSRRLSKEVAAALLAMPAGHDGLSWSVPTDYQPVYRMFRDLRTGPYAYLQKGSFNEFIARYKGWLLFAAALLVGWLVHTIRVEQRVLARTRDLRQALETSARMEHEARIQQGKLDHLARLGILGELSSMVAHELNQPLSAIGNFARGMERRIESGRLEPEPLLDASREVAEQADRAREIMQRIRAFARKRESRREPVDLGTVIDSAVRMFQDIGERAPSVERRVATGALVLADRLQVEQVLLNLLKNGMDAMQDSPPTERRLLVDCRSESEAYRICVTDRGSGLDAEGQAHLFEPFFTTKPDGMGLGLSLCKSIVEAHGGRLWAEPCETGQGLAVCFTLPAMKTES